MHLYGKDPFIETLEKLVIMRLSEGIDSGQSIFGMPHFLDFPPQMFYIHLRPINNQISTNSI